VSALRRAILCVRYACSAETKGEGDEYTVRRSQCPPSSRPWLYVYNHQQWQLAITIAEDIVDVVLVIVVAVIIGILMVKPPTGVPV